MLRAGNNVYNPTLILNNLQYIYYKQQRTQRSRHNGQGLRTENLNQTNLTKTTILGLSLLAYTVSHRHTHSRTHARTHKTVTFVKTAD